MSSFYYSVIGILAISVHLILNYDMFKISANKDNYTERFFHIYLITVLLYYITDALWGILDAVGKTRILYVDTIAYYITMVLSVVFCCRYIVAFLNLNNLLRIILKSFGIIFFLLEIVILIINLFNPIFFYYDAEGKYHVGIFRNIALIIQIFMFAGITAISFIVSILKSESLTSRNLTICIYGLVMTGAIIGQAYFPLLPLYSIGLMIGICVIHVFIQEDIKNEQYETLNSLAEIFYSMHVIDLVNDTVEEFNAVNEVKEIVNHKHGAVEMMNRTIGAVTSKDYVQSALAFTDLATLADRMINRKYISEEFIGNRIGWYLASFISMETDANNKPTKVIFTTRIIDQEKRQKERLIRKTQTDEMTGMLNRRAYEEDIYGFNSIPGEDNYVYVSIDINSLKIINDTKGHLAGDELITGACQCMKECLSPYGKLYRIGGDEFVAILNCDPETVVKVLSKFDQRVSEWKGELIDKVSVSYGWISKEEMPDVSVRQLGVIADKRMYEAKSAYYRKQGVDRRGQQDAHKALCGLYTKILSINITDDTYKIINMDMKEQTAEKGFASRISEWLISFGKSGQVHPDDLEAYLKLTDLEYMKKYFASNKTSLNVFYRRKYDNGFKQVMMEIIPTNDYSDENQTLFLYVKNIDR